MTCTNEELRRAVRDVDVNGFKSELSEMEKKVTCYLESDKLLKTVERIKVTYREAKIRISNSEIEKHKDIANQLKELSILKQKGDKNAVITEKHQRMMCQVKKFTSLLHARRTNKARYLEQMDIWKHLNELIEHYRMGGMSKVEFENRWSMERKLNESIQFTK